MGSSRQENNYRLTAWTIINAILLLAGGILFAAYQWTVPLIIAIFLSFGYGIIGFRSEYIHLSPIGGYANWITFVRLLLIIYILAKGAVISDEWIFAIALTILLLDGIDGFVARKWNHLTSFGARFDLEVDALFACILSVLIVLNWKIGEWFLIPGFLRYLFVLFAWIQGRLHRERFRFRFGPLIGTLFLISMMSTFVLEPSIYRPVLIVTSIILCFSFAMSIYFIYAPKR